MRGLGKRKSARFLHLEEAGKFSSSAVEEGLGGERGITKRLFYFLHFPFPHLSVFCNLLSLVALLFLVYQTLVPSMA